MANHTEYGNKRIMRRMLILIAAVITAIAVAVACALCLDFSPTVDVDNVEAGEVETSSTYSNKTGNLTAAGTIKNGDVLNYSYTGSVVSVTLPKGTYDLVAYGAQGGSASTYTGGYGGYAKGRFIITASSQTLYLCIGGQGGTNVNNTGTTKATGGYNGGGTGSRSGTNTSATQASGGGGGATHIATANHGLLSGYVNYKSTLVMVAGGGGGAGAWFGNSNACGNGGNGGGTSGVAATNKGGYSTAAGTQTTGYAFGQGGTGGHVDSGGGGGGYYGGKANTTSSDSYITGGGGGSGYINTSLLSNSPTTTTSTHTGNGSITITVVSVNQGPSTKSYNVTNTSAANYFRGTTRNIDIAASTLATDPDYSNTSGATSASVYFTNGTTTNYDTLPAANAGLYLNSACTTSASAYLSWTWVNNTTLRITEIKKYPRSGVDGCTLNGRLTLYVKMRDNYGTATTRGVSIILFYLTVNDKAITPLTTAKTYTYTANGKSYEYRYGDSTSADASFNFVGTPNTIYNPNHKDTAKVKTVFLTKPIAPTDTSGYTIYASDIFSDADTAYDKVGFRTVTALSAYTQYSSYYTITYNADGNYASGIVPSITIKPTNIRPNGAVYVCATITAQTSETASKAAIGSQNTAVQLVFRLANTRPYFASSSAIDTGLNEPYIELDPSDPNNRVKTLNIADMVKDIDDASLSAYFAQGANDVKIPTNEYIQVDSSNVAVPLKTNVGSNYAGKTQIASDSYLTGEGTTPTGFASGVIAAAGSAEAATAAVTYSYDSNKVIRFTARAATQYMYSSLGRTGDFYIMIRVVDPADATDTGIWYPIAIKVTSSAPAELPTVANFDLQFNDFVSGSAVTPDNNGADATVSGDVGQYPNSVVLTPVSYVDTADGNVYGVGTLGTDFSSSTGHANPFTVDPDTFLYDSVNGQLTAKQTRPLNDVVMLDGTTLDSVVTLYDTADFFTVELVSLKANRSVFSQLNMTTDQLTAFGVRAFTGDGSTDGFEFCGLRITPKRATNGEYFQFDVNVKDSHGTKSVIRVLVKIENREVQARRGDYETDNGKVVLSPATSYPVNPSSSGKYALNKSINSVAVSYSIERNDIIQITPYDFAYDFDIDADNNVMNAKGVLNTNPSDSGFKAVSEFINKTYNIPHTSSVNSPATAPSAVKLQSLNFINIENFNANAAQYSGYINASVSSTCVVDNTEYAVPCIKIQGVSRTTSAVVQLRFTISDGYSNIDCVVTVTVNNAAPLLNTVENHPKESDVDFRISEPYNMTAEIGGILNNAYQFTAREIAYDKDGDTPTFVAGSVRIVAYDAATDSYLDRLTADFKAVGEGQTAAYVLSDYVQALFTKNNIGEDVVYIRALSSTEFFPLPIYLEVRVQDGFRAQVQYSDLHVLINVKNTAPTFVTDSLMNFREDDYSWQISYEDKAETRVARYIFNSKEMYDSTNVEGISAAAANKMYLFDDADAMQHAMLNPAQWAVTGDGINNPVEKLVMRAVTSKDNNYKVDESAFMMGDGVNAAIIYGETYPDDNVADNRYLNIEVIFFTRTVTQNGTIEFEQIKTLNDPSIQTTQYWALKITDSGNSDTTAINTNIAIAIKDDHNGKDIYTADKSSSELGSTGVTVFNFYYSYKTPGLTAMHTYYRTDGNAEASEVIGGTAEKPVYALMMEGFDSSSTYQFEGKVPTSQDELKTATFAENFKYQYFVKTLTTEDESGNTNVEVTYKYYPSSNLAFYYAPIKVGSMTSTTMPISYVAMPKASDSGTDGANKVHVTFANATSGTVLQQGAKLLDSQYTSWGASDTTLSAIYENLTLTDGVSSWSGATLNSNPYIQIGYTSTTGVLNSSYVNDRRFVLERSGESTTVSKRYITSVSNGNSIYREDKYGLVLSKKSGGERAANNLKLTLALKTTVLTSNNEISESAVEYVDVEIVLDNAAPNVSYIYPGTSTDVDIHGFISDLAIEMTTSDTQGKVVALNKQGVTNPIGDYKLYYNDADSTDTMKFLMSSATGTMTQSEIDYIESTSNTNKSVSAETSYYRVESTANSFSWNGVTYDTYAEYKANYNPNIGYEKFFDISPADGTSSTVQFTPNAKTQLSIPVGTSAAKRKEILDSYHLEEDGNGIYYPFRILFYDEVNGSPLTEGTWAGAIIKVYIKNDEMAVNKTVVTDSYTATGAYRGLPNYRFKLSKGTDFFVDVSSLLTDNDIMYDGASYSTDNNGWTDESIYFNDYLVMPDSYSDVMAPMSGSLPISVGSAVDVGMSASTLRFNAESAFSGSIDLVYEFDDSVAKVTTGNKRQSGTVRIVFSVEYNNEKPTANSITFNGSETLNITMRTGEYFTLYVADSNDFGGDVKGGFGSYTADNKGYVQGNSPYTTGSTRDLYNSFVFNSTLSGQMDGRNGNLGSLIVGNDDAPSTLRFSSWRKFEDDNDENKFEITEGKRYICEDGRSSLPMSVTVKAKGVTNATYKLTLMDGNQETTEININITVISTAPTVVPAPGLLPKGMTRVDGYENTFAVSLEYGESKEFELGGIYGNGFMTDVDEGDVNTLEVYKNIDNTKYSITNPQGISAVSVEDTKINTSSAILITATDFVPTAGETVDVQFRVTDEHGAVSDYITIKVTIQPKEVAVVATQNKDYSVTLKSFADYEFDGQPVYVNLVDVAGTAQLISDADVNAPSARYDVEVYALLKKTDDGLFTTIRQNSEDFTDECLIVSLTGNSIKNGQSEIADYVSRFFYTSISTDGKTLEFIPNSATISSETNNKNLAKIQLYITVAKHYSNEGKSTMDKKAAYMGVAVSNSALVATPSTPVNSGYPLLQVGEDETRMRESAFLEFTGTAGDSLTWDLYNTKDPDLGLFYDYDLLNNPVIKNGNIDIGGLETITFVRAELTGISETVSGKGDVLSVTPSGDGKSLTIKINRKVFTGQPLPEGNTVSYTDVKVDIYCADTMGYRNGITNNNNLVKTTITVRVENDVPEIKEVEESARLGYTITYSDFDGYVLDAKLERGESLSIAISDIIDDADIDMDAYVLLYTGSDNSLKTSTGELMGSTDVDGTTSDVGKIKSGSSTLFSVRLTEGSNSYSVSTLSRIVFTCESIERGAVGTCQVRFRDSVQGAMTRVLTINLTVDNIAPSLKPNASTKITIMGINENATGEDALEAAKSFSILDFITDANGDNYLANDPDYAEKLPTYAFIDAVLVFEKGDPVYSPTIFGPNAVGYAKNQDGTLVEPLTPIEQTSVCMVSWSDSDSKHQTFEIMPIAGVYGVQTVTLTIIDSGYDDGSSAGVLDGKSYELTLTITVANPLDDVEETLPEKVIAYGVTRVITIEELLGEDNSKGYEIASIAEAGGGNQLGIFKPGESFTYNSAVGADNTDEWRIYAKTEGARVNTTVTFKAGDVTRERTLPITVTTNNAPTYKSDGNGDKTSYEYTTSMLTDSVNRTLKIYPEDWFIDTDEGDVMTFVSPVVSSQSAMVEAMLDYDTSGDGGRAFIIVKFIYRGESELTLNVSDSSGRVYEYKITVNCTDAPEPSWWARTISLIQANWLWFWIILACILLFLILLIIIIVVVHKKRKMRREIEALLNAETELEEEMMRLGSGGMSPYQSFGFLPPTQSAVNDPGLMLGGSANNPTPNSLQLNAGTGAPNGAPAQNGAIPPPANDGFNPDEF